MNVDIVYEASWQLLSVDAGTRSCNSSHIRVLTRTVLCQLGKLETKVNPSQKSLLELEFLLRVCHQGGWLVDLCCGSGSGLIADLRLGYNVAGFDIKEAQVNAAKARIQKVSQQEVCLNVPHTVSSESIKFCLLAGCSHMLSFPL